MAKAHPSAVIPASGFGTRLYPVTDGDPTFMERRAIFDPEAGAQGAFRRGLMMSPMGNMEERNMTDIEIFSGPRCGYCAMAKAILDRRGLAYRDADIEGEAGNREELLRRLPRARTIPQIFIAGEHIGGYEDLRELDESGKLEALVAGRPG